MRNLTVLCVTLIGLVCVSQAANWPEWRGPQGNGVAEAGDYPVEFSPTKNVLWKARLPGRGNSTPVVWDDHIFITCGIGRGQAGRDGVLCFDWKGKLRWQRELGPQRPGRNRNGSGSSPSVVTDGKRIFAYFKSGTVAALDFDGKVLWKKDLQKAYGRDTLWWDLGTSPVLAGGNVVIAVMHEGRSYVVALKPDTGKVAWKVDRMFRCARESDQSYTTPMVTKEEGKTVLVIWGADHVTGHDAADGKMLWSCAGFNPNNTAMWRVISSPSISAGVAVVSHARGKKLAAVKLGGRGDVTKTHWLWEKTHIGSDVPTAAAVGGKLYHLTDMGTVTYMDIKTGREIWSKKLPGGRGKFYSSPILAGDKLYLFRLDGTACVCQVSETGMKVLSETDMGEPLTASAVPINGKLLIRGMENLYCIGK